MGVELVDLSVPVVTGMPVYPGDPEVEITPALTVPEDGVNVQRVHMGSQTGTHVDAPYHIDDRLPALQDLPLDLFTGPALVADARGLEPRAPIGPEVLPPGLGPGTILLIATGWSRHWETGAYLAHPYPSVELAEAIVAAGVRTVGIDALSADRTPEEGDDDFSLATHRVLCGAGVVIAENLRGLDRLLEAQAAGHAVEVSLFPLRLEGDGAPVRAVAKISS